MDNVKNNFEELKNLLSRALVVIEKMNIDLANRVIELEKRVASLENRDEGTMQEKKNAMEKEETDLNTERIVEQVETVKEVTTAVGIGIIENSAKEEEIVEVETEVETETEFETEVETETETETETKTETEVKTETETEMETGTWQDSGMDLDFNSDTDRSVQIVNEAAKPDWYDWEVDYPASYVDDVYKGISFNDRYEFIKELFNVSGSLDEAELLFKKTLDTINGIDNFKNVVAFIRDKFPQWDEQSDEVYRFYMAVRRKFNK